jgi:hypothetical protein
MVGKPGRFTWKDERKLISMAKSGASRAKIAAYFETNKTIERKAKALGIAVKPPGSRLSIAANWRKPCRYEGRENKDR